MVRVLAMLIVFVITVLVVVWYQQYRKAKDTKTAIRRISKNEIKSLRSDRDELSVLMLDQQASLPDEVWASYSSVSDKVDAVSNASSISELVKLRHEMKLLRSSIK